MIRPRALASAFIAAVPLVITPVLLETGSAAASPPQRASSDSGAAVTHDLSPALGSLASAEGTGTDKEKKEHFTRRDENALSAPQSGVPDPVTQASAPSGSTPTALTSFEGIGAGLPGFTVQYAPPDTASAVGPNHVVEVVNTALAVFSKSGTVLYGPVATNTVFSGFGGSCQTTNDGDAVVNYDRSADRWVISQFANAASTSGPYYECIAVSQSPDPTGAYYRYAFSYASFPDYPKVGIWPDGYYISYNLFQGNTFKGAEACALDRTRMLSGLSATQQCWITSTSYGGLLPASNDGTTPPATGAPELFTALGNTSTSILYWKLHVDWATPANSTFTGPTSLTVAAYSAACGGGACIPQPSTTNKLDSLADRMMFRLAYRNFGDHESWVVNNSVTAGTSVGVRWYELRSVGGADPTVYQQSTYAPDSSYRWMGSIAMDGSGGIGLGFSLSSSSLYPSLGYTGRAATDPLGTMTAGEGSFVSGTGAQTGTLHRWGDYATMTVDPVDDCTFWFSSEYLTSNGTWNWHTRIGSFKLASCGTPPPADDFSLTLAPTSGSVAVGSSTTSTVATAVTNGSAQSLALTATGAPAGVSVSFSPAAVTAGENSTMTVSNTSAATGSYPISVTGTGTTATRSATYTLTVPCTAAQLLNNPGFESGATVWSATAGIITSSTSQPAHQGSWKAWLDGKGTTRTDTLSQQVSLPSGCTSYSFTFWLHIDSADTSRKVRDRLRVEVLNASGAVLATLATYNNTNRAAGYALRTFSLSAYAGSTVTLRFTGTENNSLQTSFVVDDTAVNVS